MAFHLLRWKVSGGFSLRAGLLLHLVVPFRRLNELVQHLFVAFLWGCRFGPRPWARSQIKARANGDHHGNDATTLTWAVRCTVWRAWI